MNEKKTEMIVGLFVTCALIGLIIGVVWGKNIQLFSKRQQLTLRFENVRGLEEGDPVVVRGLQKGAVKEVRLGSQFVDVQLWFERDVTLYTDFQAFIESKEIMGGKQVTLCPGAGGEKAPLDRVYPGYERGDFSVLFAQSEKTLMRLDSLLARTSEVLSDGRVEQIIGNIENLTRQTHSLISETRQPLRSGIRHMQSIASQLEKDSTAARVALLAARLDTTIQTFHQIGKRIGSQEGTLGKLVHNPELYDSLLVTTMRLDSLVKDIKENPKKYVHVSVF